MVGVQSALFGVCFGYHMEGGEGGVKEDRFNIYFTYAMRACKSLL